MKDDASAAGRTEAERKPYRKPRTLSRERLEALAVVCDTGKTDGLSCPVGPIQS